jgi:hypothetical protein
MKQTVAFEESVYVISPSQNLSFYGSSICTFRDQLVSSRGGGWRSLRNVVLRQRKLQNHFPQAG